MRYRMVMAFAAACILALSAHSAPSRAQADEFDDVANEGIAAWSVARLKVVEGAAWVLPPGESDWQEFEGNAPLPGGSRVRVADGSKAEIGLSGGGRIRLAEGADLELRALREDRVNLSLHEGRAGFLLPDDDFFSPVHVKLPDGQVVRFATPGRYRIESAGLGEKSRVVVRQGEAGIRAGDGRYRVKAGEEATVGEGVSIGRIAGTEPVEDDPAPVELTDVEREAAAPREVVTELSSYGEWVTVPAYGVVWRPHVAVGWSPYYYGHWSWIGTIGWTWISVEPWGWYPYRTGYWFNEPGYGWCWTPYRSFVSISWRSGFRHYRPSWYYPATVRFVRDSGNVRWVPLRPGERFSRPPISRNERTLAGWRQTVPRQTIFERDPGRRGREAPQWRDTHVERPARQPAVRPAPVVRQTPSVRTMPARPRDTGGRDDGSPAIRQRPAPGTDARPDVIRRGGEIRGTRPDTPSKGRGTGNVEGAPPSRQRPDASPSQPGDRFTPAPSPGRQRPAIQSAPRVEVPRVEPPRVRPAPEPARTQAIDRGRLPERMQEMAPRVMTPAGRPQEGGGRGGGERGGGERGGGERGGGERGGGRGGR